VPWHDARVRTEVRNQIQMLGNDVATEVARRRETHRRWLRLGPSDAGVTLLEVEVPADVDPTEYAKADDDYLVVARETYPSLDAALVAIHERGIDSNEFDAIWKTDNPF
jgi:hypothetical protein